MWRRQQQQEWCSAGSSSRSGAVRAAAAQAVRHGQQQRGAGSSSSSRWYGQQQQERRGAGSRSRSGVVQAAAGVGAARCGQQQQQHSAILGNSPFPGDLEPGHTTRAVGWLERLESLEMQPGTDWDQLPSNPSISSCPAACHLADVLYFSQGTCGHTASPYIYIYIYCSGL